MSHQSGSNEEDEDDKKVHECKLEKKAMEGNVWAEVIITLCGIHTKVDTVAQKTVPMFGHFVMFGLLLIGKQRYYSETNVFGSIPYWLSYGPLFTQLYLV